MWQRFVVLTGTLVLSSLTLVDAQQRGVPREVRNSMVGCWQPWDGEQWTIARHGSTGLTIRIETDIERLRSRFRVRGQRNGGVETILWNRARAAAQVPCGPRTQHGQFCMVRVRGDDGRLAVGVYARSHRNQSDGELSFTTTAERCAPSSR